MRNLKIKNTRGYLFILPIVLNLILFIFIPLFMSIYYSFTDYNAIKASNFVGLSNYKMLFTDSIFKESVKNTFYFTIVVVPVQTFLALTLAVWLTSRKKSFITEFAKQAIFIPVICSMILIGIVWRIIFNSDIATSNAIISSFGLDSISWLGNSKLALVSLMIVFIWRNVGYFMVIYIAGIMDIPDTYYEAATVDGAGSLDKFLKITLPLLAPTTLLVVIIGTIWSFQLFSLVYELTGGGPGFSTMTIVLHIYNSSFKQFNMGYGMSMSSILLLIIGIISIVQIKYFKKDEITY